jgi:hypothetical protein
MNGYPLYSHMHGLPILPTLRNLRERDDPEEGATVVSPKWFTHGPQATVPAAAHSSGSFGSPKAVRRWATLNLRSESIALMGALWHGYPGSHCTKNQTSFCISVVRNVVTPFSKTRHLAQDY